MVFYIYRWSLIAGRLPGRTDNEVKNYWNSHIRKKLILMGRNPNKPHRLGSTTVNIGATKSSGHESNNQQEPNVLVSSFHGYKNHNKVITATTTTGSNTNTITLPDLNLDLTLRPPALALA